MSTLETNSIGKYSGNNVSIDDPLKLKSYTTSQRDALSNPQAGDTIYNSENGNIDFYNGTQWITGDSTFGFQVEFSSCSIGGGGATEGHLTTGLVVVVELVDIVILIITKLLVEVLALKQNLQHLTVHLTMLLLVQEVQVVVVTIGSRWSKWWRLNI